MHGAGAPASCLAPRSHFKIALLRSDQDRLIDIWIDLVLSQTNFPTVLILFYEVIIYKISHGRKRHYFREL